MSNSLINIGWSGLNAAQYGLSTTGNNISNASTPGYSREVVDYAENSGQDYGAGYLGRGVNVVTVERKYEQYLNDQLNKAVAQGGALGSYNSEAGEVNSILGDPTAGLTSQFSDVNTGLSTVANNPQDSASREAAIGNFQSMVSQFNSMTSQLNGVRNDINSQLQGAVSQINQLSSQIASLNKQIVVAQAGGDTPNQLLDQRDAAVASLNKLVGATTTTNKDGSINVSIGNGQSLVNGSSAYQLKAVSSASDPSELTIAYVVPNASGSSSTIPISESVLSGGSVGGLFQYRAQVLDPQQRALGNLAVTISTMLNQQNEAGVTLKGDAGAALFNVPQPSVDPGSSNSGSATVSATYGGSTLSQLTGDNYVLTYSGGTYTLQDTTTNAAPVTVTPDANGNIDVDGMTINVSGTPANGDSFQINADTRQAGGEVSVAITDESQLAAGSPSATETSGSANTGSGTMKVNSPTGKAYQGALLAGNVTGTYNAGPPPTMSFVQNTSGAATPSVTVTVGGVTTTYPPGTPVPYTPGMSMTIGGVSVTMGGTPNDGDTFSLSADNGPSDNSNALAMANLFTANTMGNQTFAGAYKNLVGAVGDAYSTSDTANDAQTTLISQFTQAQQSVSGVNLDEEATNMMTYEQMYQANSKVIQAASTVFDAILAIQS